MPAWNAYSFLFGPLMAFVGLGIMVLVLKWGFGAKSSLVERSAKPDHEANYGLMVPVHKSKNLIEGEMYRRLLTDAGLRANLATTLDGPRVMVWPEDEVRAKKLISESPGFFPGQ